MADDEPNDVAPELPSDSQEFRRSYRWLLLYGPWALGVIGLVMVAVGLFADRPGEVALAAVGFGAAMVIAGVLLPRMHGPLELGPGGVKGAVEGLPQALMLVAVAREAAEQAIPADEPDKERKVNEVVGVTLSELVTFAEESGVDRYLRSPEIERGMRLGLTAFLLQQATQRKREEATKEANLPDDQDS
jgi:hypothetical protein